MSCPVISQVSSGGGRGSLVVRLRRAAQMGVFAGCIHPVGIVLASVAASVDGRGRCVVHPRVTAAELGLSVATVNRAFSEAAGMGLVASRRRRRVGTVVVLSMAVLGPFLAMAERASAAVRSGRHSRFLSRFAAGRRVVADRVRAILHQQEPLNMVSSGSAHGEPIRFQPELFPSPEGGSCPPEDGGDYVARLLRERREGRR